MGKKARKDPPTGESPVGYQVQFTLPVNNPVSNVRKIRRKRLIHFEVPINFPEVHKLGYADLLEAAENAEKSRLYTTLNNTDNSE
jgi:hypothetical protein